MKFKYKYSFLFYTLVLLSSCTELIEIEPKNSTTFKNGIQTEKDIESLINQTNFYLRNVHKYTNSVGGMGSLGFNWYSDSLGNTVRRINEILKQQILPQQSWSTYYRTIHAANIPLRFIDQTNMSVERKDFYRGQAYFAKAASYLHLIRRFGDVILIKDNVILDPVAKAPWPKVADYAIELAEKAVELLPEYSEVKDAQGNSPINKSVACKGAANALLAELCAWKAGAKYLAQAEHAMYDEHELWQKAADACTAIIESGQYALAANPEEVVTKVLVGDSRESIYEVDYRRYREETEALDLRLGGLYNPFLRADIDNPLLNLTTRSEAVFGDHMKELFPPNDLRRYSFLYKLDSLSAPELLSATKGLAVPNKYRYYKYITSGPNIGEIEGINQNDIIWRLAGIYLLRAECRVRLGETAGAIADLNTVRTRAQATLYHPSEDDGDLRYTIFTEYAKKELLFEGRSYLLPMIRNGYIRKELKQYGYDQLSDQDFRDGAMFHAIRSNEFANNPLLRQNVYWFKRFGY